MSKIIPVSRAHAKKPKYADKISYKSLEDAVLKLRPSKPLYVFFPKRIEKAAENFIRHFPGKPLYAVKTNSDRIALQALKRGGIKSFDVASIEEIRHVSSIIPDAELYFMHTVKAPEDIREAYFKYGVRHFVLDSEDELYKIMRETDLAQDLNLFVRLSLPKNDKAQIDFSSKFGAPYDVALDLLKKCRPVSKTLGVSFHVGTQTTDASAYQRAIAYVAGLLLESNVKIEVLNVGGGYPVPYADDDNICTLQDCINTIKEALLETGLAHLELLSEPGRVLIAQGCTLVARVELRKDDLLYLNDGIYGGLFDACDWLGLRYPVKAIHGSEPLAEGLMPFRLAGPTCDSLDMMQGPFMLPADIDMGDWVAFENTGAYSQAMRSNFNGFGLAESISINKNI
jgi:ornithine decarboxylase